MMVTSRRTFVAGLSALAAASTLGARPLAAQAASPRIIDTHHHIYPPAFVGPNLDRIVKDASLPASAYTSWTPQYALDQMGKAGIATAIVSISTPGIWWDDGNAAARMRARICNEYGAKMAQDHPGRFGMFAAIPLPDIKGSLREIAYAYDALKLEGIGLLTSYKGHLLGDKAYEPVFEELNRRKSVVFVHPTMSCCGNVFPGISSASIEFPTDTARAITSLAASGTMARFPDVTFIFSHGGGVLPSVLQRFGSIDGNLTPEERAQRLPKGLGYELKRHYYDVASVGAAPVAMAAVLKAWPITQLTYGSDTPFGSATAIATGITKEGLSDADLAAIQRGNAARLFPRYA
ncbi:MAG TPA: amidohydrolase family protein [Stellaceae bacterium]|nr:amidohydrolase family protein [Stellaceae bacterium]